MDAAEKVCMDLAYGRGQRLKPYAEDDTDGEIKRAMDDSPYGETFEDLVEMAIDALREQRLFCPAKKIRENLLNYLKMGYQSPND